MIPTTSNHEQEDPNDEWGHHAEVPEENDDDPNNNTTDKNTPLTASDLRQMANAHFANADFESALPLYTSALEAFESEMEMKKGDAAGDGAMGNEGGTVVEDLDFINTKVIYMCNRAACLYRMEMYEESRIDALEAVNISNGKNFKAIFRLAKAQMAMKEFTTAITTLETALDIENGQEQSGGREDIQKLLEVAHAYELKKTKNLTNATSLSKLKTLKTYIPGYKPSIREFKIINELGEGNYSRVVSVQHLVTKEMFALKIIEKKKCEDLAKRQHPNVWNEIEMEKNILGERLWNFDNEDSNDSEKKKPSWCKRIVSLFHTFTDYGHLYFLESLHVDGWDLWSTLRYKEKMVGTHASLAKVHLFELLEALEFIHERGVVHRDLKAENILLSPHGHILLIDFGTAKDLIHTQFNGPEFVGTPDFMAPEAVNGESVPEEVEKQKKIGGGSDHTLDLWCFGVLIYQLLTGITPFSSPSQYLAYLKIQRGLLCRPMGITDDDAWDLITKLMKINPKQRLGADCYEYDTKDQDNFKMIKKDNGYSAIRNHPYFGNLSTGPEQEEKRPFPSLRDICLRSVAELVQNDSTNLDIDKEHPQGGGSSHDMLRLNKKDRGCIMELLEKLRVLSNPRVYRRFFKSKQEARLTKVRTGTRDYMGLTQMKDKQYQFPVSSENNDNIDTERSDVLETVFPILFMHVCNPLFVKQTNLNCTDEERELYTTQLKDSLKSVNRTRPKLVVASGYLDDSCRKLLGKINESIPVVLNDGKEFYTVWSCGGQGLVLRTRDFIGVGTDEARKCEQMQWLEEQLEQSEMTRHHAFAFIDCEADQLPKWLLKKLTKGRVRCLFGLSKGTTNEKTFIYKKPSAKGDVKEDINDDDAHDNASQSSADSFEEEAREMNIVERSDSSVLCWKLEEYGAWEFEAAR